MVSLSSPHNDSCCSSHLRALFISEMYPFRYSNIHSRLVDPWMGSFVPEATMPLLSSHESKFHDSRW